MAGCACLVGEWLRGQGCHIWAKETEISCFFFSSDQTTTATNRELILLDGIKQPRICSMPGASKKQNREVWRACWVIAPHGLRHTSWDLLCKDA